MWCGIGKCDCCSWGVGQGAYDSSGFGAGNTIAFHNPLTLPGFGSRVGEIKGWGAPSERTAIGGGMRGRTSPALVGGLG